MSSQFEWLREAEEKFKTCEYNWNNRKCHLDGYPVLDCPRCTSYQKCKENNNGQTI